MKGGWGKIKKSLRVLGEVLMNDTKALTFAALLCCFSASLESGPPAEGSSIFLEVFPTCPKIINVLDSTGYQTLISYTTSEAIMWIFTAMFF